MKPLKISAPVMLDLNGYELTSEEKELLKHPQVGGVIFFTRNYHDPEQLKALTTDVRKTRSDLLLAVDQEGGRVQRFREHFGAYPTARSMGEAYDKDPEQGLFLSQQMGEQLSSELRAYDFDLTFAPVLDVETGTSQVIGDRSWHANPEIVTLLAGAFIAGATKAGLATVGKHFPGHGAVAPDSHYALPIDNRAEAEIFEKDIKPFAALTHQLSGMMSSHVIYTQVDKEAATFSAYWLKTVLRERLKFKGIIFSDDLSMQAAAIKGRVAERALAALQAGCNMVLVCNDRESAVHTLEVLDQSFSKA